ncbi:MAG: hypothetical protein ACREAU_05275 [Nitrosopumilaceae archaeon]
MAHQPQCIFTVNGKLVAHVLNAEIGRREFTEHNIPDELFTRVAEAYREGFDSLLRHHGIAFRNTTAPSEVWDAVEEIANAYKNEEDN